MASIFWLWEVGLVFRVRVALRSVAKSPLNVAHNSGHSMRKGGSAALLPLASVPKTLISEVLGALLQRNVLVLAT